MVRYVLCIERVKWKTKEIKQTSNDKGFLYQLVLACSFLLYNTIYKYKPVKMSELKAVAFDQHYTRRTVSFRGILCASIPH